ncbi:TPA: DUF1972 domain-containing protein [Vibrio parahaemolyticus]|nr:DUF1972 domain-containing protein [Vibrio parahaemolyticus]
MDNKHVVIVGTVGLPACYGGFESLVENLTINKSENINYSVFCSSKSYSRKLKEYNGAKLLYVPLSANGFSSIFYDITSLFKSLLIKPDCVLILGVSGCLFLPIYKLFSKAKIVTNIDGLEWKRDKWGKWARKFLKWSEAIAVKYSDIIITDNKAIGDYVHQEYGIENTTIAYGGDHAIRNSLKSSLDKGNYSLGLCRIEPENNVHLILEAFKGTSQHLKFVGNWNASEFGRELKEKFQNEDNIELLDPIYDLDELFELRSGCSLYLHGHSAGGTNPSLVEMMHFETPIFAFDCSFNRYSTENKAYYFDSVESLKALLKQYDTTILKENAVNMKEIAERRYTWAEISRLYETTYQ